MKSAIYGKDFDERFAPSMAIFLQKLVDAGSEIWIEKRFYAFVRNKISDFPENIHTFKFDDPLVDGLDYLFSIGGDGTFLEASSLVWGTNIPLVGINSGRLGFLAYISKDSIDRSMDALLKKEYELEERSLLEWETTDHKYHNIALNEVSVQKQGSKMIAIHAFINGELLNSYWADGLIIATPTGSTAYSLSVGGPIVVPGSRNFIISPISPHTLAVRPVVLPDHHEIRLKLEGRTDRFLLASDYFSLSLDFSNEIVIRKSEKTLKTLRLFETGFYGTIRSKLMWGKDRRN